MARSTEKAQGNLMATHVTEDNGIFIRVAWATPNTHKKL